MTAIGIVGEDETDCKTVAVLLGRIIDAPAGKGIAIKTRYPARGGCGQLRRKATTFLGDLVRAGCSATVFVHDLDRNPATGNLNDEAKLRSELAAIAAPPGLTLHFCIPVEEIEAWFWSDQDLLDVVGHGRGRASTSPHTIRQPKEQLQRLSRHAHHKLVYSTNHNPELARKLNLDLCARHCPAFRELRSFVQRVVS